MNTAGQVPAPLPNDPAFQVSEFPDEENHTQISVVIPVLNEADNLPYVLPWIAPFAHEIILVDGGSTDDSIRMARWLVPGVRVIQQPGRGKGDALRAGFAACVGDIVVMMDADGSTDPQEIGAFIGTLLGGADFAKGSRFLRGGGSSDISIFRQIGNAALTLLVNILFRSRFTDLCYGFNAFWRDCLERFEIDCNGFEVETQLTLRARKAGIFIVEVPSFEHSRVHGLSHLSAIKDGWRVLKMILRERLSRNKTLSLPLGQLTFSRGRWRHLGLIGPLPSPTLEIAGESSTMEMVQRSITPLTDGTPQ